MSVFSLFQKPKPSIAFSFDSGTIRCVSVIREKELIAVKHFFSEDFSGALSEHDEIINEAMFVSRLAALAKKYEITNANVVIPDARAISFHTHVMKSTEREMSDIIFDHLKTYCESHEMLAYSEYISEYEIILETPAGYDLHVTLVPKSYVTHLVRLFKQAGIMVPHIETAHHAVARSCVKIPQGTGYVAVALGKYKTAISLVNGEHLIAHDVVPVGSETLLQTVQKYLKISREDADKILQRYGMLGTHPDSTLLARLYESFAPIAFAIDQQLIAVGRMEYKPIGYRFSTRTLLAYGEGALIQGMMGYLSDTTQLNARLIDVWAGRKDRAPIQNLPAAETPKYAEALSLALLYAK